MKKQVVMMALSLFINTHMVYANNAATMRVKQFSNDKVNVWKTIIYPSAKQTLPMHRHEYDRVLVALTNGILKMTDNKGKMHQLKLEKNQAYFLRKDPKNELHTDENISNHVIKVMVIELKNK